MKESGAGRVYIHAVHATACCEGVVGHELYYFSRALRECAHPSARPYAPVGADADPRIGAARRRPETVDIPHGGMVMYLHLIKHLCGQV